MDRQIGWAGGRAWLPLAGGPVLHGDTTCPARPALPASSPVQSVRLADVADRTVCRSCAPGLDALSVAARQPGPPTALVGLVPADLLLDLTGRMLVLAVLAAPHWRGHGTVVVPVPAAVAAWAARWLPAADQVDTVEPARWAPAAAALWTPGVGTYRHLDDAVAAARSVG